MEIGHILSFVLFLMKKSRKLQLMIMMHHEHYYNLIHLLIQVIPCGKLICF